MPFPKYHADFYATMALDPDGHDIEAVYHLPHERGDGERTMWLLILEAAGALGVLVFIVWWTMYSGRPPERSAPPPAENENQSPK